MKNTTENRTFRVWESLHGSYVKISVRPGQTLRWHRNWMGDEGPSWQYCVFIHEGDRLKMECGSGGRDCDGTVTHHSTLVASPEKLAARPAYRDSRLLLPDWETEERWQHDQFAEAAGY